MKGKLICIIFVLVITFISSEMTANAHARYRGIPVRVLNTPLPVVGVGNGNGAGDKLIRVSEFWSLTLPVDVIAVSWLTVPEGKQLVVTDLFFQGSDGPIPPLFAVSLYASGIKRFEYIRQEFPVVGFFETHMKSGIIFSAGDEVTVSLSPVSVGPAPAPGMGVQVNIFVSGYLVDM